MPKKKGSLHATGLARFADPINGIDADQMTREAEKELEPVRRQASEEIGNRIERLGALVRQAGNTPTDEQRAEIYSAANAVYGVAGTFDRASLGQVSFLLCELLVELGNAGTWNRQAVQLHIDAMRLSKDSGDATESKYKAMLLGLENVKRKISAAGQSLASVSVDQGVVADAMQPRESPRITRANAGRDAPG